MLFHLLVAFRKSRQQRRFFILQSIHILPKGIHEGETGPESYPASIEMEVKFPYLQNLEFMIAIAQEHIQVLQRENLFFGYLLKIIKTK